VKSARVQGEVPSEKLAAPYWRVMYVFEYVTVPRAA
jgi:hypothetical protein